MFTFNNPALFWELAIILCGLNCVARIYLFIVLLENEGARIYLFIVLLENEGVEGLYQGDILLNEKQRNAMRTGNTRGLGNRLWPGGVVPYAISKDIGKERLKVKQLNSFTRAVRRHEVSFRSRYQFFFYFFGCDGPRDKTSGHELSSRSLFLYSGGMS